MRNCRADKNANAAYIQLEAEVQNLYNYIELMKQQTFDDYKTADKLYSIIKSSRYGQTYASQLAALEYLYDQFMANINNKQLVENEFEDNLCILQNNLTLIMELISEQKYATRDIIDYYEWRLGNLNYALNKQQYKYKQQKSRANRREADADAYMYILASRIKDKNYYLNDVTLDRISKEEALYNYKKYLQRYEEQYKTQYQCLEDDAHALQEKEQDLVRYVKQQLFNSKFSSPHNSNRSTPNDSLGLSSAFAQSQSPRNRTGPAYDIQRELRIFSSKPVSRSSVQ